MADLYADVHVVPTPEWAGPLCTPGSQFPSKTGVTPAETTGIKSDGDPNNPPPEEMGDKDYQSD